MVYSSRLSPPRQAHFDQPHFLFADKQDVLFSKIYGLMVVVMSRRRVAQAHPLTPHNSNRCKFLPLGSFTARATDPVAAARRPWCRCARVMVASKQLGLPSPTHKSPCLRPDLRPPPGLVGSDTGLGVGSQAKAHVFPVWGRYSTSSATLLHSTTHLADLRYLQEPGKAAWKPGTGVCVVCVGACARARTCVRVGEFPSS